MRQLPVVLIAVILMLSGCGIPRDPDGTLARAEERGVLVVGASHSPPVMVVENDRVSGPEAELITRFAQDRGMRVRWVPGGEEQLVLQLEKGHIDLLVGGLTDKSPWDSRVALTRPWTDAVDNCGRPVKRVVAVALGENALVTAIERYFDSRSPT